MITSVDTSSAHVLAARPVAKPTAQPATSAELLFARSDWWDQAACRVPESSMTELFFSDELHDIASAKRICATCPVLAPCLEGAIARQEPWGVWGGQLFLNGRILASKRRRGRPPKTPRPEDQLPDVPIPEHLRHLEVLRTA